MTCAPSRDEVFAWMEKTGKGARAAARHYGLNENTVKAWVRRKAEGSVSGQPDSSESAKNVQVAPNKEPVEAENFEESRARDTHGEAETGDLSDTVRRRLRASVLNLTAYVESESAKAKKGDRVNMQDVANSARALDLLLERSADLLGLEQRTKPAGATDTRAVDKRIAAVFGTPAPKLRPLTGGKAEQG